MYSVLNHVKDWMLVGSMAAIPRGVWLLFGLYAVSKETMPKTDKFKANSPLEAVFNVANKLLLPVFGKFPLLGPLLEALDTPSTSPVVVPASPPPPPPAEEPAK